jgi:hypothetical protein
MEQRHRGHQSVFFQPQIGHGAVTCGSTCPIRLSQHKSMKKLHDGLQQIAKGAIRLLSWGHAWIFYRKIGSKAAKTIQLTPAARSRFLS